MKLKTINLWKNNLPCHTEGEAPVMHYFAAENKQGDSAVLIFPGGAYLRRAPHEGEGYALYLNSIGIDAFVVDYRVSPNKFPAPLLDARRAIRLVRAHAAEFGINPSKIAVMGSSAGGHLAALAATYKGKLTGEGCDEIDEIDCMPNRQILCYPVMDIESHAASFNHLLTSAATEHESVTPRLLADKNTPPAFIWHSQSDESVSVLGSYRYAERLLSCSVEAEMHIYPVGTHGVGLADGAYGRAAFPYLEDWARQLERWLKLQEFIH